jgi:hypothetical protein
MRILYLLFSSWLLAGASAIGLGGATVGIACHPSVVAPNIPFNVSVWYVLDYPRPIDIHLDAVGAVTKEWYGGTRFSTNWTRGNVTLRMTLERGGDPILWKVFVTPYTEPFPNMLGESGFLASVGPETVGDCPYAAPWGVVEPAAEGSVFIVIDNTGSLLWTFGATRVVRASYGGLSAGAEVVASLSHAFTEEVVATGKTAVHAASGDAVVALDVPPRGAFGRTDDLYLVVLLVPSGGGWENRLAQDRTYRVRFF